MISTIHPEERVLIVIGGPTASGKTRLAIELASLLQTEIISFDSRQFYQEMSIGTAVPDATQLSGVTHHFVQHISIHDPYDVARFEADALGTLDDLFRKYPYVVAVGGSGLYIHALLYGLDKLPGRDEALRAILIKQLQNQGIESLRSELLRLDPTYYYQVDLQNPNRIIRALEVCIVSGQPYSSFRHHKPALRPFRISAWALDVERQQLHKRISGRVDQMVADGLIAEVEGLLPFRNLNALQTVGYQEIFAYLDGKLSLEDALEKIKTNTRRYARRQITWFRRDASFSWVAPEELFNAIRNSSIPIYPHG